jgi:hypothetical protein
MFDIFQPSLQFPLFLICLLQVFVGPDFGFGAGLVGFGLEFLNFSVPLFHFGVGQFLVGFFVLRRHEYLRLILSVFEFEILTAKIFASPHVTYTTLYRQENKGYGSKSLFGGPWSGISGMISCRVSPLIFTIQDKVFTLNGGASYQMSDATPTQQRFAMAQHLTSPALKML